MFSSVVTDYLVGPFIVMAHSVLRRALRERRR